MTSQPKINEILKSWHLKIVIITGLVVPTITATGAFFDLKVKMSENNRIISERITNLELDNSKNFADKDTMKQMQNDIRQMREDMVEVKTLLQRKFR